MTSTRGILLIAATAALGLEGCSGTNITNVTASGGSESVGGSFNVGSSTEAGGASSADTAATGGAIATAAGGASTGGTRAAGGSRATGGAITTGGLAATGGVKATGGAKATGGTTAVVGTTGAHTNPLSQQLIDQFVASHNAARSGTLNPQPSPALPPVTWDYTLADSAYNYLSRCPGGSVDLAPHNANRASDYRALGGTDSVGENIYASTGASVTPQAAVNSWMSEAPKYNYETNNISAAGHYTQIVWRDSVRIGCAIVNCSNYRYSNTVLCDYAPAGNNTAKKPY